MRRDVIVDTKFMRSHVIMKSRTSDTRVLAYVFYNFPQVLSLEKLFPYTRAETHLGKKSIRKRTQVFPQVEIVVQILENVNSSIQQTQVKGRNPDEFF